MSEKAGVRCGGVFESNMGAVEEGDNGSVVCSCGRHMFYEETASEPENGF